jgi:hypothetical protein
MTVVTRQSNQMLLCNSENQSCEYAVAQPSTGYYQSSGGQAMVWLCMLRRPTSNMTVVLYVLYSVLTIWTRNTALIGT